MTRQGLLKLLKELAEKDLAEGHDVYDHPCSVAIRAIDRCYDDIGILRRQTKRHSSQSKRVQTLIAMPYDPEW